MTRDQAEILRSLVRDSSRAETIGPAPTMLLVTGGKGGVGTTTVAVQFALTLARAGRRVLLVDGDPHRSDATTLCGVTAPLGLDDLLASRREVHEVIQPGPLGMQVIPGSWAPRQRAAPQPSGLLRLIAQLRSLGRHADTIVIDAGNGIDTPTECYWQACDSVVLVTATDAVSVMDTYAKIKVLSSEEEAKPLFVLVNRPESEALADDVFARIDRSCRRFLNLALHPVPALPDVPDWTNAAVAGKTPNGFPYRPAAEAMECLAERVLDAIKQREERTVPAAA